MIAFFFLAINRRSRRWYVGTFLFAATCLLLATSLSAQELAWQWTASPYGPSFSPRSRHTAVSVPHLQRVYVFGGEVSGGGFTNDIFYFDVAARTYVYLEPSGEPPTIRRDASMVYDPLMERLIVFGGDSVTDAVETNDLWSYYINDNRWERITFGDPAPSARCGALMAIIPPDFRYVIIMGGDHQDTRINDVWLFDLVGQMWFDLTADAGTRPPPRVFFASCYDFHRNQILFFGGDSIFRPLTCYNDLWSWHLDDASFERLTPTGTVPSPRGKLPGFYDHVRQDFVMMGGMGAGITDFQTYAYNVPTNTFSRLTITGDVPSYMRFFSMSYDSTSGYAYLMDGSQSPDGSSPFPIYQIREYDVAARTMTAIPTTPANPLGLTNVAGTSADAEGRLYLVGNRIAGTDSSVETWAYNIGQRTYELLGRTRRIRARQGELVFWDATDRRIIILGGTALSGGALNECWAYGVGDGSWSQITTSGWTIQTNGQPGFLRPSPKELWLYEANLQTRIWHRLDLASGTWTSVTPTNPPSRRAEMSCIYDPSQDGGVLFGGFRNGNYYNGLFLFNPATNAFSTLPADVSPGGRRKPCLTRDAVDGSIYAFGGSVASGATNELWRYYSGTWTQPLVTGIAPDTGAGYLGGFSAGGRELSYLLPGWVNLYDVRHLSISVIVGVEPDAPIAELIVRDLPFDIRPNPVHANGSIVWRGSETRPVDVRVWEMTGREVLHAVWPSGSTRMRLPELRAGVYQVRLLDSDGVSGTRRIVVE